MNRTAEAVSPSQLVDALQWRYAVKKFDPAARVSPEAPSSGPRPSARRG